jgi:hypothetical protein
MNKGLSDALIKGKRINSNEWQFAALAERRGADGYIVKWRCCRNQTASHDFPSPK